MKRKTIMQKGLAIGSIFVLLSIVCFPVNGIEPQENKEINNNPFQLNQGNTLFVGGSGPGNYTSIKGAISDSVDGDTVFVYDDSSPYYEDKISVSKSINLIGEDKETTIIEGSGTEKVVIITAHNVDISGFTITKSGAGVINDIHMTKAGIYNQGADNTSIHDNILRNNRGEGICIRSSENCIIEDNLIMENGFRGILIIKGSHNILVTHNTIRNNSKSGILGSGAKKLNVIENNILFNNDEDAFGGIYGVEFIRTYESNINRNNFYDNRADARFEFYGYTGSTEYIYFWLEFLKEKRKGNSLRFDANYWNEGRTSPFELSMGYIFIEGPFSWMWEEFRYSKYDWRPAKKPYDIPGWEPETIPDEYSNEEVSQYTTQQSTIQSNELPQDPVEIPIQIHGVDDVECYTISATISQRDELEAFVDTFKKELDDAETPEETISIFNNAIVTLDEIGLIPNDVSVIELQNDITGNVQLSYTNPYSAKYTNI